MGLIIERAKRRVRLVDAIKLALLAPKSERAARELEVRLRAALAAPIDDNPGRVS